MAAEEVPPSAATIGRRWREMPDDEKEKYSQTAENGQDAKDAGSVAPLGCWRSRVATRSAIVGSSEVSIFSSSRSLAAQLARARSD